MMSRAKLQSFKLNMATSGTILRIGAAPRRSPAVATRVTRNGIHYSRYLSRPPARARTRAPHLRPIPTSSPLTLPAADPRLRHHRPALSRPTSARGRPAEGRAAPRRDGRDAPDQWPGQARGPRDWQPTLLPSTPAPVPGRPQPRPRRRFWPPLLAAAFGRRFWPTLDGSPLASLPPSLPPFRPCPESERTDDDNGWDAPQGDARGRASGPLRTSSSLLPGAHRFYPRANSCAILVRALAHVL
jgi:hypothetical protein